MSVFKNYSRYYDLLYKDKNYEAETNYIHKLITRHQPKTKTILDLGCGTGRHDLLLAEKEYSVHGVDFSKGMVKEANKRKKQSGGKIKSLLEFSQGDIRTIRLKKKFDVVISLFHVISYQKTNEDLKAAFQTAKHHLKKGGIFIFDCWYGPCVITEKPEIRLKKMEDDKIKVIRAAQPVIYANENLVDVNYRILIRDKQTKASQEIKETHTMRYLFRPEVEKHLEDARLKLIHFEEWITANVPGFNTFSVCFICKN